MLLIAALCNARHNVKVSVTSVATRLKAWQCCRCEEARSELKQRSLPGSCECMRVDLGDFASVRAFAKGAVKQLRAQHQKIKILVNNAVEHHHQR